MKSWYVLVLALTAIPLTMAVRKPYQDGKIVSIEEKAHTHVLYYLVNTPVTQDDPYYDVTVKLPGGTYVGEYNPRHSDDTLPDDWSIDMQVQARIEKRHLFVKRPNGIEVDLIVVKHTAAGPSRIPAEASPAKK
jgi:hypothetical protein